MLKISDVPLELCTKRLAPPSMVGSPARIRRFVQLFSVAKQLLSSLLGSV